MTFTRTQRDEAIADLRERLHPGQDIYVIQRSVSRSGMCRRLDLFYIQPERLASDGHAPYPPTLVRFTWSAARALDWSMNDVGLRVDGAGMDMHFHTVYSLGRVLWPDGVAMSEAMNGGTWPHGATTDGGYALNVRTL